MWKLPLCVPRPTLTTCRARWPKTVRVVPQTGQASRSPCLRVQSLCNSGQQRSLPSTATAALPASVLETAFDVLEARDLVVGPTHDGGYYLVGARASHSDLFARDGMGTANALEALFDARPCARLSVHLTDPFYDIDVEGDLTRLAAELRLAPAKAPRTAVWLKQWGQAVAQCGRARETCEAHAIPQAVRSAPSCLWR